MRKLISAGLVAFVLALTAVVGSPGQVEAHSVSGCGDGGDERGAAAKVKLTNHDGGVIATGHGRAGTCEQGVERVGTDKIKIEVLIWEKTNNDWWVLCSRAERTVDLSYYTNSKYWYGVAAGSGSCHSWTEKSAQARVETIPNQYAGDTGVRGYSPWLTQASH